jgi:hypothetical protein
MGLFDDILNKPTRFREYLNPRFDVSIWQVIARAVRSRYRRRFYPNGPEWFGRRISSVNLIMALQKCSKARAEEEQELLDKSRLTSWLAGF